MKAALKTTKTRRFRGLRAILTTLCAAAICAGAGLGLSACQEEEPTSVTITVVCTDEMRAALADRNINFLSIFKPQSLRNIPLYMNPHRF